MSSTQKTQDTLIECRNLTVSYGSYIACQDLNFSVSKGDYLCIVGSNGSGKSTLVKTILGLQTQSRGTIEKAAQGIGYLGQKSNIQRDFPATIEEVVLSGCHTGFFHTKADKANARAQIERMSLESIAKKSFMELSGGQQQRVLLARSLCAAKELLVLDEPVTGLDPAVTDEMYSLIKKLNKESGLSIIMVSHDVNRAVHSASHILHLDKNQLFFGTSEEYQKTNLYERMSHVEICNSCGSYCSCCQSTPAFLSRRVFSPVNANNQDTTK